MSGPKIISAEEIRMRAEAEERLRLVQDQFRMAEVLRRKLSEIENVQMILYQVAEDQRARNLSAKLSALTCQCQETMEEWKDISTTTDNDKIRRHNQKLQQTAAHIDAQLVGLRSDSTTLRDAYINGMIAAIPRPNVIPLQANDFEIIYHMQPDVPDQVVSFEEERLRKLIHNIQVRAKKIKALRNVNFSDFQNEIRRILGQRKRENYMIYQDLHQFDVLKIQPLLRMLENAEYDYDKLDFALSGELAAYHAVCSVYGIAPKLFAFLPNSVQEIRYATAEILTQQDLAFDCAEIMARVRKILARMGYTYMGEKEEERQVRRQIYRIHDKTILHVIFDSTGRVTMEVALEDDMDRIPSGREIKQIVSDQGKFCQDFEQIFAGMNGDGVHMKKEMLCPCGEEFARIIDTSGFIKARAAETVIDYSMYESPEMKYLEMR